MLGRKSIKSLIGKTIGDVIFSDPFKRNLDVLDEDGKVLISITNENEEINGKQVLNVNMFDEHGMNFTLEGVEQRKQKEYQWDVHLWDTYYEMLLHEYKSQKHDISYGFPEAITWKGSVFKLNRIIVSEKTVEYVELNTPYLEDI
jgi:hypothetical protein